MGTFLKVVTCPLIVATFLTACGGGGSSPVDNMPRTPALSDNADLADLQVSATDLDQIFQPGVESYTGTTGYLNASTTVTASVAHPNATVSINGIAVASGVPSVQLVLVEGNNAISVVVTAEDATTTKTYTIDLTRQSIASLAQRAYVKASNTDAGDRFGFNVSIDGDTMAISARLEQSSADGVNGDQSDNSASGAGAVYVFVRDGAGIWSQQAYLKASNSDPNDAFGSSISLNGDTLAIGAHTEFSAATGVDGDQADNTAPSAGAVYIFVRDNAGGWNQQAYLKASNTDEDDNFGDRVSLWKDTVAVSAPAEDSNSTGVNGDQSDNSRLNAGAVYVFTRDASNAWSQQAYLKPSSTYTGDNAQLGGTGLSLQEGTLAATNNYGGLVHVFVRDESGAWNQQAEVAANGAGPVALSGETMAIGRFGPTGTGAADVYVRDGVGTWSHQARITASNAEVGDFFGRAVALSDNVLAVGASNESSSSTGINGNELDNSAPGSGAVYVFTRDEQGIWSQTAYVKMSNTEAFDANGMQAGSIAISNGILAVGATQEDGAATGIGGNDQDNSAPDSGAAYVFD